jgi:hypothetical protein
VDAKALAGALAQGGLGERDIRGVLQAVTTGETDNAAVQKRIKELNLGKVEGADEATSLILRMLGGESEKAGARAADKTQVQINIQPPYDQMFAALIKDGGGNKSASNSGGFFSRKSIGGAIGSVGTVAGFVPGVGAAAGPALKGLGSLID